MGLLTLLVGLLILVLGVPLGNFLAKSTREELVQGRKWFKLAVILSFIGAVVSLILKNDVLLLTFLFIGIVTSRSLRK
jgi:hypothetical protein|tara:strand:+ start:1861 stop:2094 length:234 start_codon:yes stop_codon:yes gene_type:complete